MTNVVIAEGSVARIQIVRKTGVTYEAILDLADLPKVVETINGSFCLSWSKVSKMKYAVSRGRRTDKSIYLHRLVMDAPAGLEVDHINHNGLDNRRSNLRVVDRSGNIQNRLYTHKRFTEAKHYTYRPDKKCFVGQINVDGVNHIKTSINEDVVKEWVSKMREKQKIARIAQLPKAS